MTDADPFINAMLTENTEAVTDAGPEEHLIPTDYATLTSAEMIVATLNTFCPDGIVEIRCLNVDGRKNRTDSGYSAL